MPGYEDYLLPGQNGSGRRKPEPLTGYLPHAKAKKAKVKRGGKRARERFDDAQTSARGEVRAASKAARKGARREETRDLIDAEVKLRYGGETSALKQSAANVPGYFDDYRKRLAEIQQGQQAAYGAAMGQLGTLGTTLANGAQSVLASQGPQGDAGRDVTGDAAKAAAVRQGMVGNYGGLIAGQGLAEQSYLANRAASSGPLQIQAQTAADQARADLRGEKGAYRTDIRSGIKSGRAEAKQAGLEADRRYELEKAAFGLDVTKESNDAKDDRRQTREDRRARRATNRQKERDRQSRERTNAATNATSRANNRNSNAGKPDSALTPAERRARKKEHRAAMAPIQDIMSKWDLYKTDKVPEFKDPADAKKQTGSHKPSPDELKRRLIAEGFSGPQVHLALLMRIDKPFTKADMSQARALGLRVPKHLRPRKRKKGDYDRANNASPGGDRNQ